MQNTIKHTSNFVYENKHILQNYAYYSFGMTMPARPKQSAGGGEFNYNSSVTLKNDYLYNGKELQDDFGLGWYDYGARMYDPAVGRWHCLDPMAMNYFSLTPYRYGFNNPMSYIDSDGMREGDIKDLGGTKPPLKNDNDSPFTKVYYSFSIDEHGNISLFGESSASSGSYNGEGDEKKTDGDDGEGDEVMTNGNNGENSEGKTGENEDDGGETGGGGLSNDGITLQEAGTIVGAFGAANGVKTNLVEWGMKGAEWGKAGAKYLKFVKRAGTLGFVVNVGISGYGSYDYYYNQNGTDWQVGAKATLDVAMGAAAFVWPIGTAISGAYFILDASTGGFGGWGDPYKP